MAAEIVHSLLAEAWPELDDDQLKRVTEFYSLLLAENAVQNLTRLIEPHQFIEGHVLDVKEMFKSGLVDFPALDLGSGGGVPGLLAAAIRPDKWFLCDSEGRKAAFLETAARSMGLAHVKVISGRGEDALRTIKVRSVVARAVGPVSRIYGWIGRCSTWNNLVLFKGPGWDDEWAAFNESGSANRLEPTDFHRYEIGAESKKRLIVKLERKISK